MNQARVRSRAMNSAFSVLLGIATVIPGLLPGVLAAQGQQDTLTADERKQGWVLLFDGKRLHGWDARPTSKPDVNGDWRVENGAIVCPGTTPGWLGTASTFADYTLKLEFRGAENVNSGVFVRSQKQGEPHRTGYEVQIWDHQPAGYNTGSLVGSAKASLTKILPGKWNRFEITADRDRYVIVLNGKTLLDHRDAAHSSGVVGFQCQPGNRIEFRNIRLRKLGH